MLKNMNNLTNVDKIESMFIENIDYASTRSNTDKQSVKRKLKFAHLYLIPSLIFKKIYQILPGFFKDIFFWLSKIHKSPSTKIFARTRYDELRILIDIKISSLAMKIAPANVLTSLEETFNSGFYTTKLSNILELDKLIGDVIAYSNPSHAGARPYFKDGKNKKIDGSYSAYYSFSKNDNRKINKILGKYMDNDVSYHLSTLAGYKCSLRDVSYSLSIVYGANSNDEMHQDTYSSVAKGFLYLQDVDENNAPFEYLEGTYLAAKFRSTLTNQAVLENDLHSSGSTRLRGQVLKEAINQYKLQTFTGSKGLFVLANTAGYHRKGVHNSLKPRIMLTCEVKRKGVINKLITNLLAMFKFR